MNSLPLVILFEPRELLRNGLCTQLQAQGHQVVTPLSLEQLTEEICHHSDTARVLLIGAAGLEGLLSNVLRTLHFTLAMPLKTVIYLPQKNELLARMFTACGATHCLVEDELSSQLLPLLQQNFSLYRRGHCFSASEINVLLDYSAGMQTTEIATRRHCSYKTVFTFKRNARLRLDLTTKAEWMDLLAAMAQLSSYYK